MTLADLLVSLRERLSRSWNSKNSEDLSLLITTFAVIREEVYASENKPLIRVDTDLEEATRSAIMGFTTKGEIPPREAILAVFCATPASKKA